METLEIKKNAAIAAHENAKKTGKKLLEDLFGKKTFQKDVTERINSPEDAIEELGEDDIDVVDLRNLQKAEVSSHLINYQKAIIVAKSLNEGWVPDWDDTSQTKWTLWFKMSSSGFRLHDYGHWLSNSGVGSRLCFKEKRLGSHAGNKFPEIFKEFMLIK